MTGVCRNLALAASTLLVACNGGGSPATEGTAGPSEITFDAEDAEPYAGIGEDEALHFTGTEPFWGGEVADGTLSYSTPENIEGTEIAVERFAGRNGLSFSGTLDGQDFDMAVTPGACSDGMSDRTYPFTVTLQVRGEQRQGCAWTDAQSFTGPENP